MMPVRWSARLGLVSLSVLALAACTRAEDHSGKAATPASDAAAMVSEDAAVEPIGPSEAAEAPAPAPTAAAAQAAPEIADARAFDAGMTNAAANTVEAYRYEQDGQPVRVWNDPRLGSRLVIPGIDGFVISYFRPGAGAPYLLRSGDRFYVLEGGRIVRGYDARGRVIVIRDDDRARWGDVVRRAGDAKRESQKRRASYERAVKQDRQADAAAKDAQQANRDANKAEGRADRAADRADDARDEAKDARRDADNPAERRDAQQATRDANQAAGRAGRAADRAEEASDKARDAGREARDERREAQAAQRQYRDLRAKCDRQRASRQTLDADCARLR